MKYRTTLVRPIARATPFVVRLVACAGVVTAIAQTPRSAPAGISPHRRYE